MKPDKKERWTLKGMKALVTGGTRGMGRAITESLASWGAEIVFVARNENDVRETEIVLRAKGYTAHGITADVSQSEDRDKLLRSLEDHFPRLDILVNNAG